MTGKDLGTSRIFKKGKAGGHIAHSAATSSFGNPHLESEPIAATEDLVGTGTACYRARMPDSDQWTFVVKFKWRWARERPGPHTYRHDLGSFLYVFLWTVITNHAESPPETSKLRQRSKGDWDDLAVRKSLDMDEIGFQSILPEFDPELRSLKPHAESLRKILFPLRAGATWIGTDSSPAVDDLYDGMIYAFESAVTSAAGK
ncbi:serine/threonine-protein kinase Sgk2 [Moelleriella libera RCEF 2490]|uniref:Serine/threonine-protein kinase Sgk2 n=1 Tax=Moelleriella libera RCEF 2490 TaxID=1081109 RepID=A0A166VA94_9HYPO|nr:serine/threonine-protein kinase Sgk2 [Moelleriella libera RCEF 2490]